MSSKNYDAINASSVKEPIVILKIDGLPFVFGSNVIYRQPRYDDPNLFYDGSINYDQLVPVDQDKQKALIDRKGSFSTISQKLEQWDGKASVETFNIRLVDKDQIVSKVCTPGAYLDEILNKKVTVYFGFSNIAYPEDYITLFKGYINNIRIGQGYVDFIFTDPSNKRKQVVFNASTTDLTLGVSSIDTQLKLTSTANLYRSILNPLGDTDSTVHLGLLIDDKEYVSFTNADIIDINTVNVTRARFGTLPVAHAAGVTCKMVLHIEDNPINIALKTMLSGWNGPWKTGVKIFGIINADNSNLISDSITFPLDVDVIRDYGLNPGDFLTLTGCTIPTNNGVFTIADIVNDNRTVTVVQTGILTQENPVAGFITGVTDFRNKYDVYPETAGLSLNADDVFVTQFEYIRDVFAQYQFKYDIVGSEASGKTWIETHLLKPIGAYSLTQGARISAGITHPPLANDLTKFIEAKNVINPKEVIVERGLSSSRLFYNEILFKYNYDAVNNSFNSSFRYIDAEAQNRMDQVSVLEMEMRGLDNSDLSRSIMTARAKRIIQRYKYAAETISLRAFFSTGHQIDAGDIMVLTDSTPPVLQITNTEDGTRGVYNRIMEVQERSIDISGGTTSVKLLSNNGFSITDRYAVIGPASLIDDTFANTPSLIKYKDSFGAKFPSAEFKKWQDYAGSVIRVHNNAYTDDEETTFTLDSSNKYIMHLSPALPFTPGADYVIEFSKYDDSNATTNSLVKSTFCSLDSTAFIDTGSSNSVFVLQAGYSVRYSAGMIVYVMNFSGSRFSPDVKIVSVVGDVVTIGPISAAGSAQDLGFIPQNGDELMLGGFKDGLGYRLI